MSGMNREQEIFCGAMERRTGERAAYLDAACASWPEARARVEALLKAAREAGGFLPEEAVVSEREGEKIGRYRLVERVGEGGFGVVYRAEQDEPVRRMVALKIIKLGMDTRAVVARFEAERQALAMMEHPNIARVFDGGATETGRPYFVMELVRGVPITTFCDERRLTVRERLELFLQVCRAVHHAHQKGVIHRDLKPSNVLITLEEERPVAKVIDFGIAKATGEPLTEKTLLTRRQMVIGTPAYMSPEQVGLGSGDVDTRSDIYSLGALLYELLVDAPVLDAAMASGAFAEVQRAIQQVEPKAPSQRVADFSDAEWREVAAGRQTTVARLVAELKGDLDRIVLKCLEKDRGRRYETTDDLARDVMRFLTDEPVLARPATWRYRTAKFVRRHRRGVTAVAATLAVAAVLGAYHAQRLAAERDRARLEARKAAKVSELLTEIVTAADPFRTPTPNGVLQESAERVRREFPAEPEVRAEILNAIGRVHLRRGEHEKARPVLEEALVAGRQIGRADVRLGQTLSDLGILRRERGDFAGARPLLEEALLVRRELWREGHNEVAISLVELSRLMRATEELGEAEALLREALAMRRRVLGPRHREVAVSMSDLGMLLWQKGEIAEAERWVVESLEINREALGAEHPNTGQSLANLALFHSERREFAAAEGLLREGLGIFQKAMGLQHWRTATVRLQLAEALRGQGRVREGLEEAERAIALVEKVLGMEHTLRAALLVERARGLLVLKEAGAAEGLLREALRVQRKSYPETNWRVATTKSVLGAALVEVGRGSEAEELFVEAARDLREVSGPEGRETRRNRERLLAVRGGKK